MTNPPPIQPNLTLTLDEPLPETMKRALARLKVMQDHRAKSPGAYWRRFLTVMRKPDAERSPTVIGSLVTTQAQEQMKGCGG